MSVLYSNSHTHSVTALTLFLSNTGTIAVEFSYYQCFLFTNECTSDCLKNSIKIYIKI